MESANRVEYQSRVRIRDTESVRNLGLAYAHGYVMYSQDQFPKYLVGDLGGGHSWAAWLNRDEFETIPFSPIPCSKCNVRNSRRDSPGLCYECEMEQAESNRQEERARLASLTREELEEELMSVYLDNE